MDDVSGIASLAQMVVDEFYKNPNKPKGKGVNVSVSASSFVPKPFTTISVGTTGHSPNAY